MKNRLYEPVKKMNNDRSGQRIEPMYFGLLLKLKLRRLFYFHKIRFRGFLKNGQNGKHVEGTAAGVSSCLPGVQRAGSPLCQECKGWQHLAGVKGQSP